MVSESPGRNMRERRSSLETDEPRRSRQLLNVEDCRTCRILAQAAFSSGGVTATARWQGHAKQLAKPSSPHREIDGES
jgi:hypothetical protein